MTIRELSIELQRDEKTIRRWAKRAADKMPGILPLIDDAKKGAPAQFSKDQVFLIIETGLGRNAADLYRMNAQQKLAPAAQRIDGMTLTQKDLEIIGGIVSAVMANLDQRVQKIETRVDERQALLPAPQIKPRDHVSKLVLEYAHSAGIEHRDAWKELYREFGYRTNSNPQLCAKNRGMTVIDYIDAEGQIETLESVAIELWGRR